MVNFLLMNCPLSTSCNNVALSRFFFYIRKRHIKIQRATFTDVHVVSTCSKYPRANVARLDTHCICILLNHSIEMLIKFWIKILWKRNQTVMLMKENTCTCKLYQNEWCKLHFIYLFTYRPSRESAFIPL